MVKKTKDIPERGDVVLIDYNPKAGKEMKDNHFALVLSNTKYNQKTGCIIACPITSSNQFHSIWIEIPDGLPVHGFIIPDQVKHLDWGVIGIKIKCKFPDELVTEALEYIKLIIDDPA